MTHLGCGLECVIEKNLSRHRSTLEVCKAEVLGFLLQNVLWLFHVNTAYTIFSIQLLDIKLNHTVSMRYIHVLISWMLSWEIYQFGRTLFRCDSSPC